MDDADTKAVLDREVAELIELILDQRRKHAKMDSADPMKNVARGMLQGMGARMSALLERRNKLVERGTDSHGAPFDYPLE